jgi:hypothetical protein
MRILGNLLRFFTIYLVYPAIVISLFTSLGYYVYKLIQQARDLEKIRRITGALLPVVGLVFVIVLTNAKGLNFGGFYDAFHNFGGFLIGLIVGVSVILIGNYLRESDLEILPSVFTLYLSFIAVFVLCSIIQFKLEGLNYFIVGTIIGGGGIVIWRGIPRVLLTKQYNPWTVKGKEQHQDIARDYLSQEVGLTAEEIDYIIANTSFVQTLSAGNYVFNYYLNGVYFSSVTRGDASTSPAKTLSTLKKRVRASLKSRNASSAGSAAQRDNPDEIADTESSIAKRLQQW